MIVHMSADVGVIDEQGPIMTMLCSVKTKRKIILRVAD